MFWRHSLEIERRHGDGRRQERSLDVERDQQAEKEGIDAEMVEQRQENRDEDDDDLRPFERPAKDENDDLADDEESDRRQIEPGDEILDDGIASERGEYGREGERADEQ